MITVEKECLMCGKMHVLTIEDSVEAAGEYALREGMLHVQDVFRDLNPMEREFIKTGYCPECQRMLFGSDYNSDRIREVL